MSIKVHVSSPTTQPSLRTLTSKICLTTHNICSQIRNTGLPNKPLKQRDRHTPSRNPLQLQLCWMKEQQHHPHLSSPPFSHRRLRSELLLELLTRMLLPVLGKVALQSLNGWKRRRLLLILKWVRERSRGSCACMKKQLRTISSGGTAALEGELVSTTTARVEEES